MEISPERGEIKWCDMARRKKSKRLQAKVKEKTAKLHEYGDDCKPTDEKQLTQQQLQPLQQQQTGKPSEFAWLLALAEDALQYDGQAAEEHHDKQPLHFYIGEEKDEDDSAGDQEGDYMNAGMEIGFSGAASVKNECDTRTRATGSVSRATPARASATT